MMQGRRVKGHVHWELSYGSGCRTLSVSHMAGVLPTALDSGDTHWGAVRGLPSFPRTPYTSDRAVLAELFYTPKFVIPTLNAVKGRNLLVPWEKRYHVYIMASRSRILYVGMTGFLMTRILQHKSGETDGFTKRYEVHRLVYYDTFRYVNNAIARETQIKGWRREKKIALIEANNPTWEDLAAEWGKSISLQPPADSSPSLRSGLE